MVGSKVTFLFQTKKDLSIFIASATFQNQIAS